MQTAKQKLTEALSVLKELRKEVRKNLYEQRKFMIANYSDAVLEYLYPFQGEWTCHWNKYFAGKENDTDVTYAFPDWTNRSQHFYVLTELVNAGFVGGCSCGCRGDFEITNMGLRKIGKQRFKEYTGY